MSNRCLSLLTISLTLAAACSRAPDAPISSQPESPPTGGSAGTGKPPGQGGAGGGLLDGSAIPGVADAQPAPPDAETGRPGDGGDRGPDAGGPAETALTSCKDIMDAATAFLGALEPAKKTLAALNFEARKHYRFTPEATRPGLPLKSMTQSQQDRALALLRASLSDSGYQKAMLIRTMDNWLKANVGQLPFDSMNYYVAIYGTPSALTSWAWHWEGHHASLHFTFVGCMRAASTPLMFGVEPAELGAAFQGAPAGTRVLGKQEDLARSLASMLAADPAKKTLAIAPRGGRMLPNTPDTQTPQTPPGLPVAMMSPVEAAKLKELLSDVAGNVNPELAALRLKKVEEAGFEKLTFFWAGSMTRNPNAIYYFRIQGPTFIFEHNIEWENHVHSAWRDFEGGDFGADLLQQHLRQYPHRSASLYAE